MKWLAICLFFTATLSADSFILENETQFQKIAVQWASSARNAQEKNDALIAGNPIAPSELYFLKKNQSTIPIPQNATYFRVLVWEPNEKLPDRVTNWIEFVPNQTYPLKEEYLTPVLLMNGMGC